MSNRTVVLVAPYVPGGAATHLGAAKKIELVAGLLRRLGFEVHLVDSSHAELGFVPPVYGVRQRLDNQDITLWRPFCLPSRKLGKLLNVFFSGLLFRQIAAVNPALVWLYNSYSFEARLGLYLRRHTTCKLVLELEDLPRARNRGLNPKPLLDEMYFRRLLRYADLVTFVNGALQNRFANRIRGASLLFPSIIQDTLTAQSFRPRFTDSIFRLGYFGGLESDKGGNVLLESLSRLPEPWRLVVTGAGTLEGSFRAAQSRFPTKLEFHGRVSHQRVAELMQECDAIVNPHSSIAHMQDGVFPFKVCEALASGALLISTPLPPIDIDLSRAVLFFDGSPTGLANALAQAPRWYQDRNADIITARDAVSERYGEKYVFAVLNAAIASLLDADPILAM